MFTGFAGRAQQKRHVAVSSAAIRRPECACSCLDCRNLARGALNHHETFKFDSHFKNTSLCLATIRTIPPQTTAIPAGLILCPPRTTLPVNETCQRRLGPKGGLWRPALLQLGNFSTTHLGAWSAIQSKDRPPLQSSGPMTDRSQIMHAMQRSRSLSRLCFSPAMGLICTALPSARHPQRFDFAEGTDRAERAWIDPFVQQTCRPRLAGIRFSGYLNRVNLRRRFEFQTVFHMAVATAALWYRGGSGGYALDGQCCVALETKMPGDAMHFEPLWIAPARERHPSPAVAVHRKFHHWTRKITHVCSSPGNLVATFALSKKRRHGKEPT
ncbi:hypothetical protein IWZ01DRAFT_362213 [Phyllosticta capitalensis]